MPFRPEKKPPQFADLKGILAQAKQLDNPLYQTVQVLIDRLQQFQGHTTSSIATMSGRVGAIESSGGSGGGGGTTNPPVTVVDTHYDSPLSDGNLTAAELIFADGECIIVQVPNP